MSRISEYGGRRIVDLCKVDGLSFGEIEVALKKEGIKVSYSTIYRFLKRYK